jgi:hypothetical protein
MSDERKRSGHKLSAWISDSLYDDLKNLGYFGTSISQTETITKALKILLIESQNGNTGGQKEENWRINEGSNDHVGDIGRLGGLQIQVGDLQELIKEKDRHLETLKVELEKSGQDKESIQNLYSNYMLQMQTLINQKAIESPGAKKPWWRFW